LLSVAAEGDEPEGTASLSRAKLWRGAHAGVGGVKRDAMRNERYVGEATFYDDFMLGRIGFKSLLG